MTPTWILVADASRARLFGHQGRRGTLVELDVLLNPEARSPGRTLERDAPPRVHDRMGPGRHRIEPRTPTHEKAADAFARTVAATLLRGLHNGAYERVVLVAPPRFLGRLRDALDSGVRARVETELALDLTGVAPQDLEDHVLRERLRATRSPAGLSANAVPAAAARPARRAPRPRPPTA